MNALKKYIAYSFLIHIIIIIIASCVGALDTTKKGFIVFGAHTLKPSSVRYKSSRQATPFVGKGTGKHGGKKSGKKTTRKQKKQTRTAKKIKNKIQAKKSLTEKKASVPKGKSKKAKSQEKKTPLPESSPEVRKKAKPKPTPKPKEPEPEPEEIEEEKEEIKPEEKPIEQKAEELATPQEPDEYAEETPDDTWEDTDEVMEFNNDTADEKSIKIYQTHIQKEVARLWRPPLGVPKGTICSVLFVIDSKGNIQKCEIIKQSKMLIYDLSIMRVAKSFKFDPYLWNKKFTIDFKQ